MNKILGGLMLVCILTASLPADELHVGSGQAYSTIDAAYADAWSTDTIVIHEGVYATFPALNDYDASREGITFKRYSDDRVVIDLSSRIYIRYYDDYTFDGLIFDATDSSDNAVHLRNDARHITFKDCVFYNAPEAALYAYDISGHYVSDIAVEGCTFYSNGIGLRGAGEAFLGDTDGIIKDNLFIDNGVAIQNDGKDTLTIDYSCFWGNTIDVEGNQDVVMGQWPVTVWEPVFDSTTISEPLFMYLAYDCPVQILKGSSTAGYIGARGIGAVPSSCGDPHTYYYYEDISGPSGERDCVVDSYDFAAMADNWLDCNNPQGCE